MAQSLSGIELFANDDPNDFAYLAPQQKFTGNKRGKFFDRAEYEFKDLHWWIMRCIGPESSAASWQHESSKLDLDANISANQIAHLLNTEYVFGFDYEPLENDLLKMHFVYRYIKLKGKMERPVLGYVSFLYSDGQWAVNKGFDHIRFEFELFRKGNAEFWMTDL